MTRMRRSLSGTCRGFPSSGLTSTGSTSCSGRGKWSSRGPLTRGSQEGRARYGPAPGNNQAGHLREELQPHRDRGAVHLPRGSAGGKKKKKKGGREGVWRGGAE